ncbi:MAG: inositol monophosphatase [bacterium]|nr:inositol monophosphatase [bacterium]
MRLFIESVLREAGALAASLAENAKSERKEDRSLVSEADREVESLIQKRIQEKFPEDAIIGEELGAAGSPGGRLWAIDPIDGTNPFLWGLPTWGVCIGVMEGGAPLAGGVFLPRAGELFLAEKGQGATRNDAPLSPLRPITLDNQTPLLGPSSRKRFYKLDYPGKAVAYGSAAAHIVYAAAGGGIAALVDRPRIWDILGPMAVMLEVGGGACHPGGTPLDLGGLANGEKAEGPVFFGHPENAEQLFPCIEVYPRPQ